MNSKKWMAWLLCWTGALALAQTTGGAIETSAGRIEVLGQNFQALAPIGPSQTRIVVYSLPDNRLPGATSIFVNGAYHASLIKGAYSDLCYSPGAAEIGARQTEVGQRPKDQPDTITALSLQGARTYFLRVREQSGRPLLQPVAAEQALQELPKERLQQHTISRVAQDCITTAGVEPVQNEPAARHTLQSDTLFAFGRSDRAGLTVASFSSIDQLMARLRADYTSVTESFNSAGISTSTANGGTTTATTNYVSVNYYDSDGSLSGQQMYVPANNSNIYGFTSGNFLQVGTTNDKGNNNVRLDFTSAIGPFTALSFTYSDMQPSSGNYDGSVVSRLVINGQTINLTANSNPQTVSWSGGAVSSFYILTTNDQWGLDEMSFTPASQTLSTSNSNTLDNTPLLQGTLSAALSAGQTLDVYDGATRLGAATVSGTSWSYQVASASASTHNYVAKVVNSSSVVVGSSNTFVLNVKTSPLVLDLNGDGVQTTSLSAGASFDIDGNGTTEHVAWVNAHDGLLVRDLNGNGSIDNGAELFGNSTLLPDGTKAQDGWAALAALDSNGDGKVDAQDAAFGQLRVWQDANGNGVTDAGELKSLSDLGIASVNTGHDNRSVEQNGNTLQGFGSFTTTDGATHQVADAWLQSTTNSYAISDNGVLTLLDNHAPLDLSKVTGANALTEVNASADASANVVKLSLADLLAQPAGANHQLKLTGDSNDTVALDLANWTNTGTTVTENGHTYAVYNANALSSEQLLIDQHMLVTQHS